MTLKRTMEEEGVGREELLYKQFGRDINKNFNRTFGGRGFQQEIRPPGSLVMLPRRGIDCYGPGSWWLILSPMNKNTSTM